MHRHTHCEWMRERKRARENSSLTLSRRISFMCDDDYIKERADSFDSSHTSSMLSTLFTVKFTKLLKLSQLYHLISLKSGKICRDDAREERKMLARDYHVDSMPFSLRYSSSAQSACVQKRREWVSECHGYKTTIVWSFTSYISTLPSIALMSVVVCSVYGWKFMWTFRSVEEQNVFCLVSGVSAFCERALSPLFSSSLSLSRSRWHSATWEFRTASFFCQMLSAQTILEEYTMSKLDTNVSCTKESELWKRVSDSFICRHAHSRRRSEFECAGMAVRAVCFVCTINYHQYCSVNSSP